MSSAILSVLNTGIIPPSINHTYITLIPKVKSSESVSEFRPIFLCNILYKLVSKLLANRLKKILPNIISESQSAFQTDKDISNKILVAFESLHHMKLRKRGRSGFMAMKLDISQAYDLVEWVFLEKLMVKMGFDRKWISLVMACISTVLYSILVNREPRGNVKPSRGIRQGDPPYLLIYFFFVPKV